MTEPPGIRGPLADLYDVFVDWPGRDPGFRREEGEVVHEWRAGFRDLFPDHPLVRDGEEPRRNFWRVARLLPNGDVIAIWDLYGIFKLDRDSKVRRALVGTFEGNAFSSPNDVVQSEPGVLYFSDPTWQLGSRPKEIDFNGVYGWEPGGEAFLVQGEPIRDRERLVWTVDLRPA